MGKNYFEMIRDGILVDGSGGGDAPAPVLIEKSVTENGTYTASSDNADGYSSVTVEVPSDTPTLITKSISANGTYSASDDSADGYSTVSVDVPNSYTAQDEGKVVQSGALVAQTATSTTTNGTIDTTTNNSIVVNVANSYVAADENKVVHNGALTVQTSDTANTNGTVDTSLISSLTVAVPNTYAAGDEGKVVSNGALVAQGSDTVAQNGTVDTTLISSLIVNVPSAGGDFAALTPVNTTDFESDLYICIPTNSSIGFVFGQLTTKHRPSTSDSTAEFYLPASFPASKIGSSIAGVRVGPRSSYAKSVTIYKTESNTIRLSASDPWYDDSSSNPYTLIASFNIVT